MVEYDLNGANLRIELGESAKIEVSQALNYIKTGQAEVEEVVQSGTTFFNENVTTKTRTFNNTVNNRLSEYNSNADNKLEAYNNNTESKTTTFNNNATSKTSDFNNNASSKTTAFNDNYTAKKALIDAEVQTAKDWATKTDGKIDGVDYSSKYYAQSILPIASDITAVSEIASEVTTVSGIASDVTTVSGIAGDVTAVKNNATDISAVADDLTNIGSVAGDLANIDAVSGNTTNINAVNANKTNIDTVAGNISNVNTVSGISSNVTTVAGIASDVTVVKNNATDISTVAGDIININAVAADLTNIDNASTYAAEAKQWAIGDPTEPSGGSAKYWAGQAAAGQVQADWTEADTYSKAYILNKPTAGTGISFASNQISIDADASPTQSSVKPVQSGGVFSSVNNLQQQIDAIVASSDVFDIVGTYAELQAYDITTVPVNDIIKVLVDSTHDNAATYYRCIESGGVKSWSYIGAEGAYYTKSETNTLLGAKQDTITGGATSITSSNLTASRALVSDSSGKVAASSVTSTELGYLSGVTGAIQTQIGNKYDASNPSGFITSSDNITGSAATLTTKRTIDGVEFNGSANVTHYGTCSTAAATTEKAVSCSGFKLESGANIYVKFDNTNTATNPTLNVNSTGAKSVYYAGVAIAAGNLKANRILHFIYNGSQYEFVGEFNTNTTNSAGSTDTSSKIFLVGATSQTSSATTYSHDTVYVDTAGCLCSSTPTTTDNSVKAPTTAFVVNVLKAIYPVGAVYIGTTTTCPLEAFFGTWTPQASGIVTSVTSSVPVKGDGKCLGLTNGTVNLGVTGPSDSGSTAFSRSANAYGTSIGTQVTRTTGASNLSIGVTTDDTKSGLVGTVTSTRLTVSIWKRTA